MSPWYQNLPLWVTFLPLLGALLLLFVPKESRRTFELGALAFTVADFILSVPLWFQYDRGSAANRLAGRNARVERSALEALGILGKGRFGDALGPAFDDLRHASD